MSDKFNLAAEEVKNLTKKPTDDQLLALYGLYKQVTVGDVNTSKPAFYDVKGAAKWKAWDAKKGTSKEAAEAEYIALVESLKAQK